MSPSARRMGGALAALLAGSIALAGTAAASGPGPSTTTDPYVLPAAAGVDITSLLTVGDSGAAGNGYEMVGLPDGLGATRHGNDYTIYLNHELRDTVGIARKHGQTGAFVSRWNLDRKSLAVDSGEDLIQTGVRFWDYPSSSYVTSGARFPDGTLQDVTFGRFCSGSLAAPKTFKSGSLGYDGAVWFANEEDGDNGRVFAVTEDGQATQLPRLGLFSWENAVPAANKGATTLVMGQEDGPGDGSQLWVYVGSKQRTGSAVEQAGLTNGTDYVLDAVNEAVSTDAQWRATYGKGVAARVDLAEIPWSQTGAVQNGQAKALGLNLNRIEDGHWDPRNPNDFYFLTTEGSQVEGTGADLRDGGGLWRLRWTDIDQPQLGAELTLLLDGNELIAAGEPKMNKPDNMVVDSSGNVLIQEDPGSNNHIARIVAYRIADGRLGVVARFDSALFGPGATADPLRLTIDEESSGIIELGKGEYLFDAQAHTAKGLPAGTGPGTVQEYVERGQLLMLTVDNFGAVYGS